MCKNIRRGGSYLLPGPSCGGTRPSKIGEDQQLLQDIEAGTAPASLVKAVDMGERQHQEIPFEPG
jgi:hypothetical protein